MMRFSELHLERYGRFEDHRLRFQPGPPDFHIIYGPNEAGKSTTLAAVTDLLFGIPQRSPYNFRFDYALMRIGAVLEEDGQSLLCRRRKTKDKSLIDADDQPVNEGRLAALLHGLTRDTFGAGFSLDQAGLRAGGEAMVKANDDLGQALFAAGSGLTGIAALQAALTEEADGIWGARAAARRTFTIAERQYEESQRSLKEHLLRPKEWSDASAAVARREEELKELKQRQTALSAERRAVERLRRTSAPLQQRAALLAEIAAQGTGPGFTSMEEDRAEAALATLAKADADRGVSEKLRDEAVEKLATLSPDAITDLADRIEALVERRGAITKAQDDLHRLETERSDMAAQVQVLRAELSIQDDPPAAATMVRLRAIATRHANAEAGRRAHEESLADPRRKVLTLRNELADAPLAEGLGLLRTAIARAHGLGEDFDGRCAEAIAAAEEAERDGATALARLAPWQGDAGALARLQTLAEPEIQAAQDQWQQLAATMAGEQQECRRLNEGIERVRADRTRLADAGQAVALDDLIRTRTERDTLWHDIQAHLLQHLPPPTGSSDAFSAALTTTDTLADRRFDNAEASARLALLDGELAALTLLREQVAKRLADAQTLMEAAKREWSERLSASLLPVLDPVRLRHWQALREEALDRQQTALEARRQATRDLERRAQAIDLLRETMASPPAAADRLAPLLTAAGREKEQGEKLETAFTEKQATLTSLESQIARAEQLMEQDRRQAERALADWAAEPAAAGITLDPIRIDDLLSRIDLLRTRLEGVAGHEKRMQGIQRDRQGFTADIAALATQAGTIPDADPARTLDLLRTRLAQAQAVAQTMTALIRDRDRRRTELDAAEAERRKALASLAPILAQAGLDDPTTLPAHIEASRRQRSNQARLAEMERQILANGDGHALADLTAAWEASDPDRTAVRAGELEGEQAELTESLSAAADALGEARRAFAILDERPGSAAADAADAEAALAEMGAQADAYVLKRAQSLMLRWAMDRYRERRQDPLLRRACDLFRTLTLGRFSGLRIDYETTTPRLLGLRDDGTTLVPIDGMSEGTTDQLFLALRLAAVEQSIAAGVRVPFLADDLFVNFDDERSMAGLRVLADLARSTQVLFFTHHAHLCDLGRDALGVEALSEHRLA
ncbi:AAA family ATPase [Niveispirillum sp. KHB5.9]|uniref:ATP-binding protein n=1 Tax=Niveispirillum sp. KHB5.9 TaxID=3400269 RepID=UPI003A88906E